MSLVTALAVSGQPTTPGQHDEHSRFSEQGQGFPPQPLGMSDVQNFRSEPSASFRSVATSTHEGGTDVDPVGIAAADPDVAESLGSRAELMGVVAHDAKSPGGQLPGGGHQVTWFVPDRAATVTATVIEGQVTSHQVTPAEVWQPPLSPEEADRAIRIARDHWTALGQARVGDLAGFAMHTMDPDGSYPSSRMAYVTHARHVDARPELLSWVDLTTGAVERTRIEDGGDSPAGPSHFSGTGPSDPPPSDRSQPSSLSPSQPRAGHIDWQDWSFDYEVSDRMDGVALANLRFQDVPILARASMPAMTVFYDEDACGPFVDRLGGELTPVDWADGAEVVVREFTIYDQPWMELGVLDTLGEYVLYQSFYLGPGGQLDAHTFAKGLQCNTDHVHYPFWRLDFDIAGPDGDQIRRGVGVGNQSLTQEFDLPADAAVDHDWTVHDLATGHEVHMDFDDGTWNVPGQVVPESLYRTNQVYGRQFENRSGAWTYPAVTELPGNRDRSLDDVVVWYRGFLPHATAEGPALWHSTGVRMTVDLHSGHSTRAR